MTWRSSKMKYLKVEELRFKCRTAWFQGCSYPPTDPAHTNGRTQCKETGLTVARDRHCLSSLYEFSWLGDAEYENIHDHTRQYMETTNPRFSRNTGSRAVNRGFLWEADGAGMGWALKVGLDLHMWKAHEGQSSHWWQSCFTLPYQVSLFPCNHTDVGSLSLGCIITLTANTSRGLTVCYWVPRVLHIVTHSVLRTTCNPRTTISPILQLRILKHRDVK